MSWDAIGALAEIVGAVAVVVTLIFLTLQIRQNTASVRQQCYNDIMVRRQEIFLRIAEDQELHQIWSRGLRGETFTEADGNRFTFVMVTIVGHLEDCFIQYQNGVVEKRVWEREARVFSTPLALPAFVAWWNESQQFFVPEFVEEFARQKPLSMVFFDEATGKWSRPGRAPNF